MLKNTTFIKGNNKQPQNSANVISKLGDMRKSIDILCAIVTEPLQGESNGHSIYLFCGKRCDRIKVLSRRFYSIINPSNKGEKSWREAARTFSFWS